jgi:hypothetical protein
MDVDSDDEDSDGSNVPKKKVSVNRTLTYILCTAMPVSIPNPRSCSVSTLSVDSSIFTITCALIPPSSFPLYVFFPLSHLIRPVPRQRSCRSFHSRWPLSRITCFHFVFLGSTFTHSFSAHSLFTLYPV